MTNVVFRCDVTRAAVSDSGMLSGYASVFDVPTTRQADFKGTETIGRTAFDGLLTGDVVALVDHNMSNLLGRTSSGTLRLSTDQHGLAFELDLPDTQLGRDTRELVKRGDLRGMSFSAQLGKMDRTESGVVHKSFSRLIDVSVVTSPAYPETSVVARNEDPEQSLRAQLASLRGAVLKGNARVN